LREPSSAAKEFFAGNILPACGLLIPKHLSTWTGPRIYGMEELGGKSPVVHLRSQGGYQRNFSL
jgi:hypothetical protein